jgi:hypothetical protein
MSPKALIPAAACAKRVPISPAAYGVTPDDVETDWLDGDRAPKRIH